MNMFRISVYTGGFDKKPHIHTQEKQNRGNEYTTITY